MLKTLNLCKFGPAHDLARMSRIILRNTLDFNINYKVTNAMSENLKRKLQE